MNRSELISTAPTPRVSHADPDRWVDEHGDCLYRFALLRVGKTEIAKDLVQETLLAAVRAHEKFCGRSGERSWLVGILKKKICDHFRKVGRETTFTDLDFFSDEHSDRFNDRHSWIEGRGPSDWVAEGDQAISRTEFWQAIHTGLGKLPERVATVFIMREIEEIPSKEICTALDISEANLWVMLHRARMALRLHMEADYFEGKGGTDL